MYLIRQHAHFTFVVASRALFVALPLFVVARVAIAL